MSSYTVTFKGTRAEKEAQALKECKEYLGRSYKRIVKALKEARAQSSGLIRFYRWAQLALSFAGIQGKWPVRAMVRQALIA